MSVRAAVSRRLRSGLRRRLEHALDRFGLVEPRPEPSTPGSAAAPAPAPAPAPAAATAPAPADDVVGPALSRDEVQELLDDMVRPALQMDGGDIRLVDVKGGDVYVQLIGACNGCPSSTATLKNGIERLLEEELPDFRSLVPVDGPLP